NPCAFSAEKVAASPADQILALEKTAQYRAKRPTSCAARARRRSSRSRFRRTCSRSALLSAFTSGLVLRLSIPPLYAGTLNYAPLFREKCSSPNPGGRYASEVT